METKNRYDGVNTQAVSNIRFHARRLALTNAVPWMELEDFEQDLVLDLLRRQRAFDPSRASFATFADRVIEHRVAALTAPTLRLAAEREMVSLSASVPDEDGEEQPIVALLADNQGRHAVDDQCCLKSDVARFFASLPAALQRCCLVLMSDNVSAASRTAGLHRSTVYDGAKRLLVRAEACGLSIYVRVARQFERLPGK
jgi:hypothetical protein